MAKRKTHIQYENELFQKEIDCYPIENYVRGDIPIKHECLFGHVWKAKPSKILDGTRCPICYSHNRFKTHEQYEAQLLDLEIDYYPIEQYQRDNVKILHECLNNHSWYVTPNDILKGNGCPQCSSYSFKENEPAILYFISFVKENIKYYKLGVTNKDIQTRFKTEPIYPAVEWEFKYSTGKEAKKIEKELLNKYSSFKINTGILKRGNTETLSIYIPPLTSE